MTLTDIKRPLRGDTACEKCGKPATATWTLTGTTYADLCTACLRDWVVTSISHDTVRRFTRAVLNLQDRRDVTEEEWRNITIDGNLIAGMVYRWLRGDL